MSNKVIITRVGKDVGNPILNQVREQIAQEMNIDFHIAESIDEVFPLLSNPFFHTDYINIDVESFYNIDDTDVFDIIQTLHTLIKCTVERTNPTAKPTKRNTKIGAIVSSNTPISVIKEIMKFPAIHFILPKYDGVFSADVAKAALKNQLLGIVEPHKCIIDLIRNRPKTVKNTADKITLTSRQTQILDLICTKGASNKIIARILGISESTVKLHVSQVFKKYGVKSRTQLAVFTKR